jgi:hypothetical protein
MKFLVCFLFKFSKTLLYRLIPVLCIQCFCHADFIKPPNIYEIEKIITLDVDRRYFLVHFLVLFDPWNERRHARFQAIRSAICK